MVLVEITKSRLALILGIVGAAVFALGDILAAVSGGILSESTVHIAHGLSMGGAWLRFVGLAAGLVAVAAVTRMHVGDEPESLYQLAFVTAGMLLITVGGLIDALSNNSSVAIDVGACGYAVLAVVLMAQFGLRRYPPGIIIWASLPAFTIAMLPIAVSVMLATPASVRVIYIVLGWSGIMMALVFAWAFPMRKSALLRDMYWCVSGLFVLFLGDFRSTTTVGTVVDVLATVSALGLAVVFVRIRARGFVRSRALSAVIVGFVLLGASSAVGTVAARIVSPSTPMATMNMLVATWVGLSALAYVAIAIAAWMRLGEVSGQAVQAA